MKFLYCNNLKREIFEEALSEKTLAEDIIHIFSAHGYPATDSQKLALMVNGNTVPFNEDALDTQGVIIIYSDIVAPDNAVEYDTYKGIFYFFHTNESVHEHTPHVHAKCKQANGELWIPLDDPENYIGHYSNRVKEIQAKNYVKKNHAALMKQWNKIISGSGL